MKKRSQKIKFNRNAAFSMNLGNSDEKDSIQRMFTLDNKLICFLENSITEVLTAETIDPKNEEPETRHSHQTIYQIGTNNSFVARTIIQAREIIESVALRKGLVKQTILNHIWACSELLFNCEESYYQIFSGTHNLMHECDTIINNQKKGSYIHKLPQVKDLEQHVGSFLGNAKRFLERSHKLLCIFYDSPYFESNFKFYRDWLAKNKPNNERLLQLLEKDKDWIQFISWSRNALDVNHSQSQFNVIIENFKLHKGNKFSIPSWRYDFTSKNGGIQKKPSGIIKDMDAHMNNMLTFFEEMFMLCIQDNWDGLYNFKIYKHPDNKINNKCPIVYFVTINSSKQT